MLALPLLDSMGWAEPGAKAFKPPVRLGFMYMPHGVIMDQFWPKSPETFRTAPRLRSNRLRPVLDQCLMVKGISGVPIAPFNGAPHALELSTWLTAKLPDANHRNRIDIGISADQIAATYVGGFTSLPSLELATMPQDAQGKSGRVERGLLHALQFQFADPAPSRRRSIPAPC